MQNKAFRATLWGKRRVSAGVKPRPLCVVATGALWAALTFLPLPPFAVNAQILVTPRDQAQGDPLSAIGWLSQSVAQPVAPLAPTPAARPLNEPPISTAGALPSRVATTSLEGPQPDRIGLITPSVANLPQNLWGQGLSAEINQSILADRMESLPALRQLFLTILLLQSDGPADGNSAGAFMLTRVDKLMMLGALEQARALIEAAGPMRPDLFRRAFDIAILRGAETRACEELQKAPGLAPTLQAQVFCLARAGNWDAAALTLSTATTLGDVPPDQALLLSHFLDPDLFEGEEVPAPPDPVTPLDWKLYEAIGETIPTSSLPVAFAHAELGQNAGWKAQIEAAERLTRTGSLPPNILFDLYTQRAAAASGGVWERVRAFQAIERALALKDPSRISAALPNIWAKMQEIELETTLAFLFAPALTQEALFPRLSPEAQMIALRLALLAPNYQSFAKSRLEQVALGQAQPLSENETFLLGLALGDINGARPPNSMGRAIATAFSGAPLSQDGRELFDQKRIGEALLLAINEIQHGIEGDLPKITSGLSLLLSLGQKEVAQRTALELMILERRG